MPVISRNTPGRKTTTDGSDTISGHMRQEDYRLIVDWLQIKTNYQACFGTGKSTSVGRPPKTKINGYQLMALHLRNKTQGRLDLTPKKMADRFKTYRSKYRKAQMLSKSTGFGLTDEDRLQGISSVAQKLDTLCPYFSGMDELFGSSANITPLYHADAQLTPTTQDLVESKEDEEQLTTTCEQVDLREDDLLLDEHLGSVSRSTQSFTTNHAYCSKC